jgi:hypothetical protein
MMIPCLSRVPLPELVALTGRLVWVPHLAAALPVQVDLEIPWELQETRCRVGETS